MTFNAESYIIIEKVSFVLMNNNQVSLLNKKMSEMTVEKKLTYKIYMQDLNGKSYSTRLNEDVVSINDAIIQAIKQFNQNINAHLPTNP